MPKTPGKPPFSIVSGETTVISPPRKLGAHGRQLWDRIQSEYGIADTGGVEILCQICQSLDRAERLAEAITKDGEVVYTRAGVPKSLCSSIGLAGSTPRYACPGGGGGNAPAPRPM